MTELTVDKPILYNIYGFEQSSVQVSSNIDRLEGAVASIGVTFSIENASDENRWLLPYRFIADSDFDGSITSNDFRVFEISGDGVEIEITDQILDIDEMNSSFRFKNGYPRQDRTIAVRYRTMKYPTIEMREAIRKLLVAYAFDRYYRDLRMETTGDGMTSWSLNGVSVSIDVSAIQSLKEMYDVHKKQLMASYKPLIFRKFTGNRILRYPYNKTGFVMLGNVIERFRRW